MDARWRRGRGTEQGTVLFSRRKNRLQTHGLRGRRVCLSLGGHAQGSEGNHQPAHDAHSQGHTSGHIWRKDTERGELPMWSWVEVTLTARPSVPPMCASLELPAKSSSSSRETSSWCSQATAGLREGGGCRHGGWAGKGRLAPGQILVEWLKLASLPTCPFP